MKQGWALWITGLPASGKSTVARMLAERLESAGVSAQVLESDALRKVITPYPTYSEEERETFYRAMIHIGSLLAVNGVNVIFDATANRRRWRREARKAFPRFLEVFVDTPLSRCRERDPKGIYQRAEEGKAVTVPGIQQGYEAPESPEATVDGTAPPRQSAGTILSTMRAHGFEIPDLA